MIGFNKRRDRIKERSRLLLKKRRKTRLDARRIRLESDLSELEKIWMDGLEFPDPTSLRLMELNISPTEGIWKEYIFRFEIKIPDQYPLQPPRCKLLTKIWHPNIDEEGFISLNVLRNTWSPILGLNVVFTGLLFLFFEPNPDDPLNYKAGMQFIRDYDGFVTKANSFNKNFAQRKVPRSLSPEFIEQAMDDLRSRVEYVGNLSESRLYHDLRVCGISLLDGRKIQVLRLFLLS